MSQMRKLRHRKAKSYIIKPSRRRCSGVGEGGLSFFGTPGWETRSQGSKPGSAMCWLGDTGKVTSPP